MPDRSFLSDLQAPRVYRAQEGVFVGRPPCTCGAAQRLHLSGACPRPYQPETLEIAYRELAAAQASNDATRVFVARGNVQRLGGDPDAAE